MDADRIRQAAATWKRIQLVEHEYSAPLMEPWLVIVAAAEAHADCLDGPTDEDVERFVNMAVGPTAARQPNVLLSRLQVRQGLEAVFQARKERG